jgi:hypothetical protein
MTDYVDSKPDSPMSAYHHHPKPATYNRRSSSDCDSPPVITQSIKVHTRGPALASGFPYHPQLFDLNVHPTMWADFTSSILQATKLTAKERARVWAAGATSPTSSNVGHHKSIRIQENKVKYGLRDMSKDSLGGIFRHWNEGYFAERGLFARMELSEVSSLSPTTAAASPTILNSPTLNSPALYSPTLISSPQPPNRPFPPREANWYAHRDRAQEGKRFSVVMTQFHQQQQQQQQPPPSDSSTSPSSSHHLSPSPRRSRRSCDSSEARFHIGVAPSPSPQHHKPLPDLPCGADPLAHIAAELSNMASMSPDEPPPLFYHCSELEVADDDVPRGHGRQQSYSLFPPLI